MVLKEDHQEANYKTNNYMAQIATSIILFIGYIV